MRVDLGAEQPVRRAKVYNERGRPLIGHTIRMAFNDAGPRGYHRHYGFTIACSSSIRRPRAQEAPCDSSLARIRLFAGLPASRSDRARARGALLQALRAAVLRSCVAALLPRALERRRLRPLLYADADRADVELRPIAPKANAPRWRDHLRRLGWQVRR